MQCIHWAILSYWRKCSILIARQTSEAKNMADFGLCWRQNEATGPKSPCYYHWPTAIPAWVDVFTPLVFAQKSEKANLKKTPRQNAEFSMAKIVQQLCQDETLTGKMHEALFLCFIFTKINTVQKTDTEFSDFKKLY